jgi:hypothetical protein
MSDPKVGSHGRQRFSSSWVPGHGMAGGELVAGL